MKKTNSYITLATNPNENLFDENKPFVKYGSGERKALYHNEELNNLIIVNTHKGSSVSDAVGYVVGERWTHLSEVLTTEANVVVEISKVEGTTSDYIINYDFENPAELLSLKTVHEVIKRFHEKSRPKCGYYSNKCMEFINGTLAPIVFEERL